MNEDEPDFIDAPPLAREAWELKVAVNALLLARTAWVAVDPDRNPQRKRLAYREVIRCERRVIAAAIRLMHAEQEIEEAETP